MIVNQNALIPIQVSQTALNPVATTNVDLSANLPATPVAGTATLASPISSDITVFEDVTTRAPQASASSPCSPKPSPRDGYTTARD